MVVERIAAIGDVGGHLEQLREALLALGADPERGRLPPGLAVVQVGDLVHKGPESDGVVELVDRFLATDPRRWVQLEGNHEACYVREDLFLHDAVAPRTAERLRAWRDDGLLRLAVAVETASLGPTLITHAGLTAELWQQLGRPATPSAAVRRVAEEPALASRPGRMLGGVDTSGGVQWAEAVHELYGPWLDGERAGVPLPFSQVHGHSSAVWWARGRTTASGELARRLVVGRAPPPRPPAARRPRARRRRPGLRPDGDESLGAVGARGPAGAPGLMPQPQAAVAVGQAPLLLCGRQAKREDTALASVPSTRSRPTTTSDSRYRRDVAVAKTAISMDEDPLEDVKAAVARGAASSVSAYLSELARRELRRESVLQVFAEEFAASTEPSEADLEVARHELFG